MTTKVTASELFGEALIQCAFELARKMPAHLHPKCIEQFRDIHKTCLADLTRGDTHTLVERLNRVLAISRKLPAPPATNQPSQAAAAYTPQRHVVEILPPEKAEAEDIVHKLQIEVLPPAGGFNVSVDKIPPPTRKKVTFERHPRDGGLVGATIQEDL